MHAPKLIVLGLDGIDLALLRGLAQTASLSFTQRCLREGRSGPLLSTLPPSSPAAWSTIVTGQDPGRHGVFHFREPLNERGERPLITSASLQCDRLWHLLNRQGLKTGVVNLPVMNPADPMDGFSVSGMLTPPGSIKWIHPRSWADQVREVVGLPVFHVDEEEDLMFVERVAHSTEQQARLVLHLCEKSPVDLLFVVFVQPDRLFHRFFPRLSRLARAGQAQDALDAKLLCAFSRLDQTLQSLCDSLQPSSGVFMVSDHGFGPVDEVLCVNKVLMEMEMARFRLTDDPVLGVLKGGIEGFVDWDHTSAYLSSPLESGVIINATVGKAQITPGSGKRKNRVDLLCRCLSDLVHPVDGRRLFQQVVRREDLYEGPFVRKAPDIVLIPREERFLLSEDPRSPCWVRPPRPQEAGMHRREGMWVYAGSCQDAWPPESQHRVHEVLSQIFRILGMEIGQVGPVGLV